jgi:hypothetical protein
MGAFKDFVNNKLNEEARKVSSNLLKNIIDVLKEYIATEFDLTEDEKMQIINNMEIGVEDHDKGILNKGPRFIASSNYDQGEGKQVPVEIVIEIVTEKIGQKQEVEPAESPDVPDEVADEESSEEVPEETEEE